MIGQLLKTDVKLIRMTEWMTNIWQCEIVDFVGHKPLATSLSAFILENIPYQIVFGKGMRVGQLVELRKAASEIRGYFLVETEDGLVYLNSASGQNYGSVPH